MAAVTADARRASARFVQAAFARLQAEVEAGNEVPYALDARGSEGATALYDYRPLFRAYTRARRDQLQRLPDTRHALDALSGEAAIRSAARDHAAEGADDREALFEGVLEPLVASCAEGAGAFAFDDVVFATAWDRMVLAARSERRALSVFTPLTGIRLVDDLLDLGGGVSIRRQDPQVIAERWPEAIDHLPQGFGSDLDRTHALELELLAPRGALRVAGPDATDLAERVVIALRLLTGGAVTAGPALHERVDWAAQPVRLLPAELCSTRGAGGRLDAQQKPVLRALIERLRTIDEDDPRTAAAVAAYAASGVHDGARRVGAQLRVLEGLLATDGAGPHGVSMRAAALLGDGPTQRRAVLDALRDGAAYAVSGVSLADADRLAYEIDGIVRGVLVAAIEQGGGDLGTKLDDVLIGARPRPRLVAAVASA